MRLTFGRIVAGRPRAEQVERRAGRHEQSLGFDRTRHVGQTESVGDRSDIGGGGGTRQPQHDGADGDRVGLHRGADRRWLKRYNII